MWKQLSGFTWSVCAPPDAQKLGTWGERLKTPSRMSDLFFVFVLVPKQIQRWRKLSASSAGEICLLELQLLWEDPFALGLLPDWTCSQILFLMRFPALVR